MANLRGVEALQKELVRAHEKLKDVDEKIKKYSGLDPADKSIRPGQRRKFPEENKIYTPGGGLASRRGRGGFQTGRNFEPARRISGQDDEAPPVKRRMMGSAFGRLGERVSENDPFSPKREGREVRVIRGSMAGRGVGMQRRVFGNRRVVQEYEDPEEKRAVQSSVVPADTRTRDEALKERTEDEQGKARSRRMFGALLGTLQRFKKEENTTYSQKEKAREDVEKKLEQRARKEKAEMIQQKRNLFEERRNKELKLKQLEQKMELVKIHEDWVNQTKILMNFIRTKAKPSIFYLPKTHNTQSQTKLQNSQEILEEVIEARRQALEEELQVIGGKDEDEKQEEQEPTGEHEEMDTSRQSREDEVQEKEGEQQPGEQQIKTEPVEETAKADAQESSGQDMKEADCDHGELDYEHEYEQEEGQQEEAMTEGHEEQSAQSDSRRVEVEGTEPDAKKTSGNELEEDRDKDNADIKPDISEQNTNDNELETGDNDRNDVSNNSDVSPSEEKKKSKKSHSERKKEKKSKHKRRKRSYNSAGRGSEDGDNKKSTGDGDKGTEGDKRTDVKEEDSS